MKGRHLLLLLLLHSELLLLLEERLVGIPRRHRLQVSEVSGVGGIQLRQVYLSLDLSLPLLWGVGRVRGISLAVLLH